MTAYLIWYKVGTFDDEFQTVVDVFLDANIANARLEKYNRTLEQLRADVKKCNECPVFRWHRYGSDELCKQAMREYCDKARPMFSKNMTNCDNCRTEDYDDAYSAQYWIESMDVETQV